MDIDEIESKYEVCSSWGAIVRKPDSAFIEVNPRLLFGTSAWRICIINDGFAIGRQATEPFMLVKGDFNNIIYGQAHIVRADNSILTAYHLDSELLLSYLEKYENEERQEPRNKLLSTKHNEYLQGGMSLESLKPLMTELQWINRDPMAIFIVKTAIQKHLLERKNQQLEQYQTQEAEDRIMGLERRVSDTFEHIRRSLVGVLFKQQLFYRKRKTRVNNNGNIYSTVDPTNWHEKIKPFVLECGGYQVGYAAKKESWKATRLTHEQLSYILNNGRSLAVTDKNGHEYEPTDGELYYNTNNCRLVIKYMPEQINKGITGKRRKHKRK